MSSWHRLTKWVVVNSALLPLNIICAWALTELGVPYLIATSIGFAVQAVLAFFINRSWTFKRLDIAFHRNIWRAALVDISGLVLLLCAVGAMVEILGWNFLPARIVGMLVVGVWCYILDSLMTFRTNPFK